MHRLDENDQENINLSNIPSQVINYKIAYDLLNLISDNKEVENNWKGELNLTYSYGGKLRNGK